MNDIKRVKKATVETTETGLVWTFESGNSVEVEQDMFNAEVLQKAMIHGLKQKLSDTYAGVKTTHEVEGAFKAALDALKNGHWNAGRSSSGGIWVEALARAAGVTIDIAQAKWSAMDEATQKDVKRNAQVKLAKAQIDLERSQARAEGVTLDLGDLPEMMKPQSGL